MKQVDATLNLTFTTADNLMPANKMRHEITELFAAVLDQWTHTHGIEAHEVHLITCDDLTVEDYEEYPY